MKNKKEGMKLKNKRVRVGFTEDDFEVFKALSEKENLTPAGYLSKLANKEIRKQNIPDKSVEQIDDDSRNRIWATLSEKHFYKLVRLADKEGLKKSDLVRISVIHFIESIGYIPKKTQEDIDRFMFLVKNIANNVNQQTRHSNQIKRVVDENQIFIELKNLQSVVSDFIKGKLRVKKDDS